VTGVLTGVLTGDAVWAALAGAWVVWLVVTATVRGLPTPADGGRWLVASWAGRLLGLALWAEVGWHLFCQRP
jgi:hypothetical protein